MSNGGFGGVHEKLLEALAHARSRRRVSAAAAPAAARPEALSHLLYLHGFRSSPRSTKARQVAAWVAAQRPDLVWWCPQLPASPAATMAEVLARHRRLAEGAHGRDRQLARRLLRDAPSPSAAAAARCCSIRPSIRPATWPPRSATTTAWHSDEPFVFRAEYVDELRAIAAPARLTRPGSLLRGHRQGRRGAVVARDERALRRLPPARPRRQRPRARPTSTNTSRRARLPRPRAACLSSLSGPSGPACRRRGPRPRR